MKYLKIILLSISILATNTIWAQRISDPSPKAMWISVFKEFATYKCICEMTKDEIDMLLYKTKDYSYVVHKEILEGFEDSADSLGRKFARQIPFVSDEPKGDLYGLKGWFRACIKFGQSKQADSAAKAEYKLYQKADREWYIMVDGVRTKYGVSEEKTPAKRRKND